MKIPYRKFGKGFSFAFAQRDLHAQWDLHAQRDLLLLSGICDPAGRSAGFEIRENNRLKSEYD